MKMPLGRLRARIWLAQILFVGASLVANFAFAADQQSVITSELDDRLYRYVVLDNELKVMLISDPETDKAAASLDVAVGHGSDPEDREGLAHFLEHMLFLGTEKYPEAGEYQEYIKDHGGGHNAYTTYDHTNYFFSIRPEFLEGALDRFSQFFVAPLFNADLVKRERVVVHSEYSARSEEEGRRTLAARRQQFNPDHPRSHFAVGSLDTLADREGNPVRDDLIDFYKEHYSANLMALSVIGRESLDQLEKWVRSRFSAVPNSSAERFVANEPIFLPGQLPSLLQVVPLKERRSVTFTFEVPSPLRDYRLKPLQQISNLLGHEGEGSLLAALKSRGWASGLSAGPASVDANTALMEVHIDLTPAGVENVATVGEMMFRTIRLIRERGLQRWRFDEQRNLAEIGFSYRDKPDAMSLVQAIADRLHDYPAAEVLSAPYEFERFDRDLIAKYLSYLTADRVAVTLVAPDLETDREEARFGTHYAVSPVDDRWIARWSEPAVFEVLALPEPNPFVPKRLEMVADSNRAEKPHQVMDDRGTTLWHSTDTTFGTPRAEFYFSFRSPEAMASARNAAYSDLFTEVVEDRLNAFAYPAYLAGLGYEVYPHLRGFSVRISGFSDRQSTLLARIVASLRSTRFDPARFERVRSNTLEDYRNRLLESPSRLAMSELQRLLIEDAWPVEERIDALAQASLEEFRAFVEAFFKAGNVLSLSVGNLTDEEAGAMGEILSEQLMADVKPVEVPRSKVVRLESERNYERVIKSGHPDSVVGLYKQGRDDSYRERALFYLYDQLSDTDFYNELRTEKKLGYIVQSFAMPIVNVPGMMYLVQSPTTGAEETEAAIRAFIEKFGEGVAQFDDEVLIGARDALLSRINQRDDALSDRAGRYWRELDDGEYDFDSRQQLSDALNSISLEDLVAFSERLSGASTSSLVIKAFGGQLPASNSVNSRLSRLEIGDFAKFKEDHAAF